MKRFLLSTALVLSAGMAQAATFTFEGGDDSSQMLTLLADDRMTSVTVTAFDTDYIASTNSGTAREINRGTRGWGVRGRPEGGRIAAGEALVFDFDGVRQSLGGVMIFEAGDEVETFDIYADYELVGSFTIPAGPNRGISEFDLEAFEAVGSVFAFVGTSPSGAGNRGIRLSELTVTAVPIPAGGLLLLSGLGIMTLRKRRAR